MRKVTRHYSTGDKSVSTIQQLWDGNGKQLWTYFDETVKQFIDMYLSKKLKGKNLDVGGGWYLPYPNSDVVDVSPVCLEYNIAPPERKHLFDLETISKGAKLPFDNGEFDSATMISSIQYLPKPWDVIKEVERVLKPGKELLVIGGQDAGVGELVMERGFRNTVQIVNSFERKGYDTMVEYIPNPDGSHGEFNSVCVAMHGKDGKSAIRNKDARIHRVANFSPKRFINEFTREELAVELDKLGQLQRYPITNHSMELLGKIKDFTKDFIQDTGNIPLFYDEYSIRPEFDMTLPGEDKLFSVSIMSKDPKSRPDISDEFRKNYGLHFCQCSGELPESTAGIEHLLKEPSESDKSSMVRFITSPKFNGPAVSLAKKMEESMIRSELKFSEELKEGVASNLNFTAYQSKQRRKVDKLIEKKKAIESKPDLIFGHGKMEIEPFVTYLKEVIRPRPHLSFCDD